MRRVNEAPEADVEPMIQGVSLAQYAAVEAGTAAGLPLDVVLANEQVPAEDWPDAEEGWADRILDEDDEDEPLLKAYEERLAEAQDRYGRAVKPLDDDLGAWLDFVRRWSADDDPNEMVTRVGLRPADVLLLHRRWASRIARDPSIAERAKDILSAPAPPGELPAITAEAVKPRPPAPDHAFAHAVPPFSAVARDEDYEEDDDGAEEEDEEDEASEDDATPLFSPLPQWIQAGARAPRPAAAPPAPASRPQAVFHPEPPPPPPSRPSLDVAPPPLAPRPLEALDDNDVVTAPAQPSPFRKPSLPFQPGSAPPEIAKAAPRSVQSAAPAARKQGDADETMMISAAALTASALPFDRSEEAEEPVEGDEATAMMSAAAFLASALPFDKNAAPSVAKEAEPKPAASAPAPAAPVKPKESLSGTTAGVVMSPFAGALPFAPKGSPPEPPKPSPTRAPEAPPPPPSQPGAAPPSAAATLTLTQYASLCAELSLAPNGQEAVFHRYGLGVMRDRLRVDLVWQERLRRDPEEYRKWQALYEQYHRYLSAKRAEESSKGGGA